MSARILIGYDVEHLDPAITRAFLDRMVPLHREHGIPATLFVLGQTLERNLAALAPLVDDPLFDLQQHTWGHTPLKTLVQRTGGGTTIIRGGSPERIRDEVVRTNDLLRRELGVDCIGLTGPYTYYRGLSDRIDLLELLWECGIRFLRTDGRDAEDWQPVPFTVQPYRYEAQGFPGMLEFGVQGWADCLLRDEIGWGDHAGYLAEVASGLDRIARDGLTWSYLQHDWASIREDPELTMTAELLRMVRERGIRGELYRDVYERERDGFPGVR